ncbi:MULTISPECIES: aminoacyl-tRNA hydrolase [Jiangella]|uniref:Peptidyl-tRNA hydrolase n=1 Tax=Jiangella alba TaxID=561176 RepID=A0A1H5PV70_9ACTN|nr:MULTISPECIES: aminoacyl-tRNA hydrolase [Jiangella]SDT59474.1 peptidyl-tRNA hydrolase [Jiangella sp. DSM 45060]SEF17098.1 peptidyl-tRNA hydrolase [Jiangella alba]
MSDAWLVVGLGNPGPTYAGTRHNAGAMVVDLLAERAGAPLKSQRKFRADVAEVRLGDLPGSRAVLAKPHTYMNESGGPVALLADFYKITPDRLLVVHDELDLPFGTVRLKLGGGDNGHNGLRSVRARIGTGDYCRLRFGIGRPPGRMDPAAFVLKPFSTVEKREIDLEVDRAADAAEAVVVDGLTYAQNHYNG